MSSTIPTYLYQLNVISTVNYDRRYTKPCSTVNCCSRHIMPLLLLSTFMLLPLLSTCYAVTAALHFYAVTAALDMLCCYCCSQHVALLSTFYAVTAALNMLCCYRSSPHFMLLPLLLTCHAVTTPLHARYACGCGGGEDGAGEQWRRRWRWKWR